MGSKTGLTATGCTGTATWKIGDTGDMLAVMWSIPFDQNWYQLLSNTFERQILMSVTHLSSCGEYFLNRIGNPNSWNGLACLYSLISPLYVIFDDLVHMKGTPTGAPSGSCRCKTTPATCGRRCIMGRRSTSQGKSTMIGSPGKSITKLIHSHNHCNFHHHRLASSSQRHQTI